MRPDELKDLLRLQRPELRPGRRRIRRLHDLDDVRVLARRRTPQPVFDYVEGGADQELSLARNRQAYERFDFVPCGPADVSTVRTAVDLLGRSIALPLICSPTGYSRMMHPNGELAVARAAARARIPYGLSTVASTSIEELTQSGHDNLWFQIYIWRDRGMTDELVQRAWSAGYRVLEVSIDVPVSGFRIRDVRNGLTIPPQLTASTLLSIASKPSYWIDMVRAPAIGFANSPADIQAGGGITIENMSAQFDPSVTWEDIAHLRSIWPGPLLVKGPLNPSRVEEAIAAGVDGIHLSNHGGRQLDRTIPPVDLVPELRATAGDDFTIIVDSGIRHGADLAVAIALGADAGAIGRPYLYGLMAGGSEGVKVVLEMFAAQFTRTLQLLGTPSVTALRSRGDELLRARTDAMSSHTGSRRR